MEKRHCSSSSRRKRVRRRVESSTTPIDVELLECRKLLSVDNLVLTTQPPETLTAGATFDLTITAQNSSDNSTDTSFTGPVTVSDTFGSTITGTTTVNAVAGVATFTGLSITTAGTSSLQVTADGQNAGSATTTTNVNPGAATQLAITPPAGALLNATLDASVAVEDAYGNLTSSTNDVTISLGANSGQANLGGTLTVAATNGVADFPDLSLDQLGTGYTLTATSSSLPATTSAPFDVTDQIVVTTEPSAVSAGTPFTVAATVEDGNGVVQTNYTGSLTISNPSGETPGGTTTVNVVNGAATFSDLTLTQATVGNLQIDGTGLPSGSTDPIQVNSGDVNQIVITGPTDALLNGLFTTTVVLEDSNGNPISSNDNVTIALDGNHGSATLGGTLTVAAVNGIATFSDLTLNELAAGYTLTATSSGTTASTSDPFNVTDQIVVTTEPSSVTAGTAFTVAATVEDGNGVVQTDYTGSLTISNPWGEIPGGTTTVNVVNGVATFSDLTLTQATFDNLQIDGTGLPSGMTDSIQISPGSATQLAITGPTGAFSNGTFSATVVEEDVYGNPTSGSDSVTVALGSNPGSDTLGGTLTVDAVNGVATFSDLTLSNLAVGDTLIATSNGLMASTSDPFDVTDQIVVTTEPSATTSGTTFVIVAEVEDGNGVVQTGYTGDLTISNPFGETLGGTTIANVVNGVATFSGLTLTQAQTGTLQIDGPGLPSGFTDPIQFNTDVFKQFPIIEPWRFFPYESFIGTVAVVDTFGNPTALDYSLQTSRDANSAGAASGETLAGTAIRRPETFSSLTPNKLATGDTLKATGSSLTASTDSRSNVTTQIAVTTSPTSVMTASPLGVVAKVENAHDNLTSGNSSVTIARDSNPVSDTLGGTSKVANVDGTAPFSNPTLHTLGVGESPTTTSTGLISSTTSLFNTLDQIVVTTQPISLAAGSPLSFVAKIEVGAGMIQTGNIEVSDTSGQSVLSGVTQTITTVNGVVPFTVTDVGFTNSNGNLILAVEITALPLVGSLTDNGIAVTAGTLVNVTDITASKLILIPVAKGTGAVYASFTIQLHDNGGTANRVSIPIQRPAK